MAMIVRTNTAANRALSHVDKNEKSRSKSLAKLSSGMKINSAQDDAANFSISSRMRVKLRALDQDSQNVQNGSSILNTAEGGIQDQINILRTIREKVIDAANDHNTDEDRQTIQKEINHLYDQMETIAYGTDFNSKKPLLADKLKRLSEGDIDEINHTKLNLIRDAEYEILDNVFGPFAAFEEYSSEVISTNAMSGGVNSTSAVMSAEFSSFSDASQLNNVGIYVGSYAYVFTDDMSKSYYNATKVQLGSTVSETLNNLRNRAGGTIDGMKLQFSGSISPTSHAGGSVMTSRDVKHTGTVAGVSGTTGGGVTNLSDDSDLEAAAKATLTVNLSRAASNSGFRFEGYNFRIIDQGAEDEGRVDRTLTKGTFSRGSAGNFQYEFDGNRITFTAKEYGDAYNGRSITDGYNYYTTSTTTTDGYTAYTGFTGAIETVTPAVPAKSASWTLDLSGMTVDAFSKKYCGQTLKFNDSTYKFYDSSLEPKIGGFAEDKGSRTSKVTQIDINDLRNAVTGGQTFAEAFASKFSYATADGDSVKFTSNQYGASGNGRKVTFTQETLRHYDIDFSTLNVKFPDDLYGKGFRFYCATDNKEWFNFVFADGITSYDVDKKNIKSYNIDVTAVTNVSELLQAIYDQTMPLLTGNDLKFNHHMRLALDADKKILTVYDHRRFDVSQPPYNYQERGAKIADGVAFKEIYAPVRRNFSVKELIIQHTDKANMNIRLEIPQMTLDHIFDPLPINPSTIFDYPVTSKESRDYLLGNPTPPGILDNGLTYLLDAITLVGAQNSRLAHTAMNITTEMEKVTAAESVIRDADMAKEMTAHTKHNILAQTSQAMLAQANQIPSTILSLLG